MELYQVLNESGNPAGDSEHNYLCIFTDRKDAQDFVSYLIYDCDCMGDFEIKAITRLDELVI